MNIFELRFVNVGLFFLLILSTGYWLHHSGKPYGAILFNIHKLIGFGLFVFLAVRIYQMNQAVPLSAPQLIACVAAGLLFLATIVFGGLVSVDKPMPAFVSLFHNLFPYLTVLSTACSLYLLFQPR